MLSDLLEVPDLAYHRLEIVMGHRKGASLRVRAASPLETIERVEENMLRATLTTWRRVVVRTTGQHGARAFVLVPGDTVQTLAHGPFSIVGRFDLSEKINRSKVADVFWKNARVE